MTGRGGSDPRIHDQRPGGVGRRGARWAAPRSMQMGASLVVEQDSGRRDPSNVMEVDETLWQAAAGAVEEAEVVAPSRDTVDVPSAARTA